MLTTIFEDEYKENIDALQETVFATTLENKKCLEDCARLVKRNQIKAERDRLTKLCSDEPDNQKLAMMYAEIARLNQEISKLKG